MKSIVVSTARAITSSVIRCVRNGQVNMSGVIVFLLTFIVTLAIMTNILIPSAAGSGTMVAAPKLDDIQMEMDIGMSKKHITIPSYTLAETLRIAKCYGSVLKPLSVIKGYNRDMLGVLTVNALEDEAASEPLIEDPLMSPEEIVMSCLGNTSIEVSNAVLTMYDLPDVYYPGLDFSSFQAWMPYTVITDRTSAAYKVVSDDRMYVDENGMCRFQTTEDQFTIDGKDDYVIALATYYKPKGTCGSRWLIITSTGAYTAITGDEKADVHTDDMNMFTLMDGDRGGLIEWLIDSSTLNRDIKVMGTVTKGPIEELRGEILYIYRIE